MTIEEQALNQTRSRRIRRVKRWLRPLPRRSNIHRYPLLGRFSKAARKRIYLWSFRVEHTTPAFYAGFIITLMPLYGIQIPIAFCLALLLRANLAILIGLQMLSNPLTLLPFWFASHQVGSSVLTVIGIETARPHRNEVNAMVQNWTNGEWGHHIAPLFEAFSVMCLGGIVMGIFFGLLASFTYRFAARRTVTSYALLIKKIQHRNTHNNVTMT